MNLKTTNAAIKAAYHAKGIRGQGIIFASIDTGVSALAPFGRQLISAHFDALIPANGDSHGTKSASVLHSWCPDAKILVYNACPHSPDGPMINWILADILRRAQADKTHRYVVSMSWLIAGLPETHALIKQLVNMDVPVIVAAGNDGRERADRYPGSWPEPICAAALNVDGTVAGYSTWHGEMDFADQGEDVDVYGIDGRPSTYNGTSAARLAPGTQNRVIYFAGRGRRPLQGKFAPYTYPWGIFSSACARGYCAAIHLTAENDD